MIGLPTTLEDTWQDILAKAVHGRDTSAARLAASTGLDAALVRRAIAGDPEDPPDDDVLAQLANAVALNPQALLDIRHDRYHPAVNLPSCVTPAVTPFHTWTVNNYLLHEGTDCLLIDTGTDLASLLAKLKEAQPGHLLLTHGDSDHVGLVPDLRERFPGMEVLAPQDDPVPGATLFTPPCTLPAGRWALRALPTPGHTAGSTSFLLEATDPPVCFVGDALFAGSIGKPRPSLVASLQAIRDHLLPLPGETLLCPGHGPATSITLESRHNPFLVPVEK